MSCDMHAHIEVLHDGKWLHYASPNIKRSDILFKLFAGQSSYAQKIPYTAKPVPSIKKLPDNRSDGTRIDYAQDQKNLTELHHAGVATKNDLVLIQAELQDAAETAKVHGIKFKPDLEEDIFHTYINGNLIHEHRGYDDVRIIFWFDGHD